MKKHTLILVEQNDYYRGKFLDYLSRRETFPLVCRGCADAGQALRRMEEEPQALVLFSEEIWEELSEEEKTRFLEGCAGVGCLTEEEPGEEAEEGMFSLCRYQPMPQIMSRLTAWKDACESVTDPRPSGKTTCVALYSPGGCSLTGAVAVQAGQALAENDRVLCMDFSDFSPWGDVTVPRSLSDLLYLQSAGSPWNLGGFLSRLGELEWLPPAANPEDIWHLPEEGAAAVLHEAAARGEYDWILAVAGGGKNPVPVMKECRKIILLEDHTPGSRRSTDDFLSWLGQRKEAGLAERCRRLQVPLFRELGEWMPGDDNLRYSPFGEWAAGEAASWR